MPSVAHTAFYTILCRKCTIFFSCGKIFFNIFSCFDALFFTRKTATLNRTQNRHRNRAIFFNIKSNKTTYKKAFTAAIHIYY